MKPITIVGGGLAGLTLGIGLRKRGVPVTVLEAGMYPRHRVCGEFISGHGQQVLGRLKLLEEARRFGIPALNAAFVIRGNSAPVRKLPQPAICISRFRLDALLAEIFQSLGGELQLRTRAAPDKVDEGFVRAAGRRPVPVQGDWAWYGLKIHARNFLLNADFEMHVFENGYIGVSHLPQDEVNICGLFRRRARLGGDEKSSAEEDKSAGIRRTPNASRNSGALPDGDAAGSRGAPVLSKQLPVCSASAQRRVSSQVGGFRRFAAEIPESSDLHRRFVSAALDETSFCSVAGLSLAPQKAAAIPECCVGDALTMTPPVTGNGMSMAFESAEIAIEPLAAYARNEISWPEVKAQIAAACDQRFASRLRWAKCLQAMMFSRALQVSIGNLALRSQLAWNILFHQTR